MALRYTGGGTHLSARQHVGEISEPERIDATSGPRGLRCCRSCWKHTPLKMLGTRLLLDYYPEAPGAPGVTSDRAGNRSTRASLRRHGRAGARVWQGSAQCGCDAAGLRSPQSAQTSPLWQLRSMKVGALMVWAKATGKNLSAWVEPSLGR